MERLKFAKGKFNFLVSVSLNCAEILKKNVFPEYDDVDAATLGFGFKIQ